MKLRALEPEDLELLYTIENDAEHWDTSSTNVPYSRYALRDYLANQSNDIFIDRQVRLVIINDGGEAVGLIDLFNFCPEHQRAELGIAMLRRHRGKGYGTKAVAELIRYARDTMHLHQITAIVAEGNLPSRKLMSDAGFTKVAVLNDWLFTTEGYKNAILLQKIL